MTIKYIKQCGEIYNFKGAVLHNLKFFSFFLALMCGLGLIPHLPTHHSPPPVGIEETIVIGAILASIFILFKIFACDLYGYFVFDGKLVTQVVKFKNRTFRITFWSNLEEVQRIYKDNFGTVIISLRTNNKPRKLSLLFFQSNDQIADIVRTCEVAKGTPIEIRHENKISFFAFKKNMYV